jgi:Holliday junction DNA helicase RuvB
LEAGRTAPESKPTASLTDDIGNTNCTFPTARQTTMNQHTDINEVRPTSLKHLIGQQQVVRQIEVALDASQQDGRKFDHALLVGPPGLGKSAMCQVIADEMATGFHEVLGQSLNSVLELNALLLTAKDRDIVFIDECHEMKREFQTGLYLALDKQQVFITTGTGSPQGIPIADFSLLLATTDEYHLLQPLRDRMRLVLRLDFLSIPELIQVVQQRSRALGWDTDADVFPEIARRSRGTPRLALRLLQSCHRVCRSLGEDEITLNHLRRACELEQLDNLGLGPNEQAYLRLLADSSMRLNVIASSLGLPARTVSSVIESFLIRAGLIAKDHQSVRQLTARGREHVLNNRQEAV